MSGDRMVPDGTIGRPLADALFAEYHRRLEGAPLRLPSLCDTDGYETLMPRRSQYGTDG